MPSGCSSSVLVYVGVIKNKTNIKLERCQPFETATENFDSRNIQLIYI
jgi:hypothetical protein